MSKKDGFENNNANGSMGKFVFVDEGATDDVYDTDNEQVVSISDDTFYQDLAQDILENNVHNKLANDSADAEASGGFDDLEDDGIPEVNDTFVEEFEDSALDDDVIEVSIGSEEYVSEFLKADSADDSDDEEIYDEDDQESDDEEIYDEDDQESDGEEIYDEDDEESDDEEIYDEDDEESEDEGIYDEDDQESEDEEVYEEDNEESEDEEIYDEADEGSEDEEVYEEDNEEPEDGEVYDEDDEESEDGEVYDEIDEEFEADEPENLYSVGEAEPSTVGKVDIMGYLSEEALSEIDSACSDVEPQTEPSASSDMDMTQVYEPVSVQTSYGSDSGYVDIDDDDNVYQETSRTQKTNKKHRKHRRKRAGLKGLAQIASLLAVVAGLTWLISRVAFPAMGSSSGDKTSSDIFYGYSSGATVISFDDTSDDDVLSEDEFNVSSLGIGDKGDLVLKVQRALSSLGYLEYTDVHGTYDNATRQAVIQFQKTNGIEATGVIYKATYYALFSSDASSPTTVTTGLPSTTATETTTTSAETTSTEASTTTEKTEPSPTKTETTKATANTTFKKTTTTTTTKKTTTTVKETSTTSKKTTGKTTDTSEKTTTKNTTNDATTQGTTSASTTESSASAAPSTEKSDASSTTGSASDLSEDVSVNKSTPSED